jgi:hypothetical protein
MGHLHTPAMTERTRMQVGGYTLAEVDRGVAGDTESNADGVRLLGYHADDPNAGAPAGKTRIAGRAFCAAKSRSTKSLRDSPLRRAHGQERERSNQFIGHR